MSVVLTVPLYVEGSAASPPLYTVRPLFHAEPLERSESVRRAVARLEETLRHLLRILAADGRHEELAAWSWSPSVEDRVLDLRLDIGRERVRLRVLVALLETMGRRIAWLPAFPDAWFDLAPHEGLRERAEEALTRTLRARAREDLDPQDLEALGVAGRAWVTTGRVRLELPKLFVRPPSGPALALLGPAREKLNGRDELARVGRCLDWLYPDDLDRCLGREAEVERLLRALDAPERRPVALRGARQAGKTCIVHETVFRRVEGRPRHASASKATWLVSPQRLISGMSFVGQWEERLLAILETAARDDAVLYFDDLLGLFTAGRSRDSRLSVADVLKPWLERRDLRVVAEITPPAWRVLQERDRGFADLFVPIPVEETSPQETLRILLSARRQAEWQHRCAFEPDVLPTVLDVTRRYVRDAVFPGKAAVFLKHLAVKSRGATVGREQVLQAFEERSGLSLRVLDDRVRLERGDVLDALGARVIGQDEAREAAADAVSIAKARLNDPERPLASFLFVGPTGTGKTQCARALAEALFAGPERSAASTAGPLDRLLRFDMNEFVTPDAVARLVGTFDRPDGLLTGAVRRSPFSVVLLDEIEKAHPDAFNLLLQVMGDARLTDALGRTVSFHACILIMTSNLGSGETSLGFRAQGDEGGHRRAAEAFFPPEFFNRLDRVIPFQRLSREDVSRIAARLLRDLLGREGLVRRRCILSVEPAALDRIVESGYHPRLGARALKRELERQVAAPVAERLAELPQGLPPMVTIRAVGDGVGASVEALEAGPVPALRWPTAVPAGLDACVKRLEAAVDAVEPGRGSDVGTAQLRYYAARDCLRRVQAMRLRLAGRSRKPGLCIVREANPEAWLGVLHADDPGACLQAIEADVTVRVAPAAARQDAERDALLLDLLGELAWLAVLLDARHEDERLSLEVRSPVGERPEVETVLAAWAASLERENVLEATVAPSRITVQGWGARALLGREPGVDLLCAPKTVPVPLLVSEDGAGALPLVKRLRLPSGFVLDLERGVAVLAGAGAWEGSCLLRMGLPLPPEVR